MNSTVFTGHKNVANMTPKTVDVNRIKMLKRETRKKQASVNITTWLQTEPHTVYVTYESHVRDALVLYTVQGAAEKPWPLLMWVKRCTLVPNTAKWKPILEILSSKHICNKIFTKHAIIPPHLSRVATPPREISDTFFDPHRQTGRFFCAVLYNNMDTEKPAVRLRWKSLSRCYYPRRRLTAEIHYVSCFERLRTQKG